MPPLQVLVQECIRYNKLIDIMEQSLPELQKALKGLVVMSGELEAVGKAIALNSVPESWEAKVNNSLPSVLVWTAARCRPSKLVDVSFTAVLRSSTCCELPGLYSARWRTLQWNISIVHPFMA